jgi:hypothetical protein
MNSGNKMMRCLKVFVLKEQIRENDEKFDKVVEKYSDTTRFVDINSIRKSDRVINDECIGEIDGIYLIENTFTFIV